VLAIYETINAAISRQADVAQIAAESEIKGTPYFMYRMTDAAFGRRGISKS
jgi:hypothetical protein